MSTPLTFPSINSDIDQALVAPSLPPGLDTPCVAVDLDVLERNILTMQQAQSDAGVHLRPHLKTAKSIAVARKVLESGAVGITVATLGEAEVFAEAGIPDIFVAYPVLPVGAKAGRVAALAERCALRIGVDSAEGIAAVAAALGSRPTSGVGLMVEVDSGERRSGVDPSHAATLIAMIHRAGLRWDGVFTHGGHSYAGGSLVAAAAADEVRALTVAYQDAMTAGFDVAGATWSAGSTPTARLSNRAPVTEQRPGSYVMNDRHQAHLGAAPPGTHALVVAATVVSKPRPGACILDAGAKALAKDRATFVAGHGLIVDLPRAVITNLYDHHATVALNEDDPEPQIGQQVSIIPNHVCPVVNLTDRLHLVRGGHLVGSWPVDTRGRH